MTDINKVISAFRKKHSDLIVTMVIDYDANHYVVEAVKKLGVVDYSDPYYGVDKKTGAVSYFTPAFDLEAFNDALDNKVIWVKDKSEEQALVHHGIEGQKWGVRRYQNPDGTLTPEGRERYGYNPKKAKRVATLIKKGGGNPPYMNQNKIAKDKLMDNQYVHEALFNDKDYLKAVNNQRSLIVPYRQEIALARQELSDDSKYDAAYKELREKLKKEGKDPYPTSDEVIDYVISKRNPKLVSNLEKAADDYNKNVARVADNLLGDYRNDTFQRLSSEITVSQATREFITLNGENILSRYGNMYIKNIFNY